MADTNIFIFKISDIKEMKFVYKDHSITDGKFKPEGISLEKTKDKYIFRLSIKADRHGSEKVAKWFKNEIKDKPAGACDSHDKLPEKLNFAVKGDLILTHFSGEEVNLSNLIIAQGHNARLRNNWWIGSPDFESSTEINHLKAEEAVTAPCYKVGIRKDEYKKRMYVFCPASGKENEFDIFYYYE